MREVHEALAAADSQVGYTTVLKQLQVMQRKGLVARDDQQRAHRYKPLVTRKATQRLMASDLVDSAFDGSRSGLVLELLGDARRISAEDLDEIQARIAELEARQRSRR